MRPLTHAQAIASLFQGQAILGLMPIQEFFFYECGSRILSLRCCAGQQRPAETRVVHEN